MSGLFASAKPYRIKAAHRRRRKTAVGPIVQRYYDPTLGRFLSVDPVTANSNTGGNFNRYWYANNNPYKFTDPDGRLADCNLDWCRQQERQNGPNIRDRGIGFQAGGSGSQPAKKETIGRKVEKALCDGACVWSEPLRALEAIPGEGQALKGAIAGFRVINEIRLANGGMTILKTGHYAARLESAGLNVARTEAIISREAARIAPNLATGADVYGRMRINGVLVEYGMRKLPDGRINIGTIYPVK